MIKTQVYKLLSVSDPCVNMNLKEIFDYFNLDHIMGHIKAYAHEYKNPKTHPSWVRSTFTISSGANKWYQLINQYKVDEIKNSRISNSVEIKWQFSSLDIKEMNPIEI